MEKITKYHLLKKVTKSGFKVAKTISKTSNCTLLSSITEFENSIMQHLQFVQNWSAEILFSDLKKPKRTSNIFIDLDLFIYPLRLRPSSKESIDRIPLSGVFEASINHVALLGQPGAGKTTSIKYLCQSLLEGCLSPSRFSFPLMIRFRDLNNTNTKCETGELINWILSIIGVKLDIEPNINHNDVKAIKRYLLTGILNELRVLLILEGFDELSYIESRKAVIEDVDFLASSLDKSTLILTSRTADFSYDIGKTTRYELCPLSQEQISAFAIKWLNDNQLTTDLLVRIYNSPFADTAVRPRAF